MPLWIKIGEDISSYTRVIANVLNSFFAGTTDRLLGPLNEAVSIAYNTVKCNGDFTQIS